MLWLWALAPETFLVAIGAVMFCLLAVYIVKALPQPGSGAPAWLTGPLNLLTGAGKSVAYRIIRQMAPAAAEPQQHVGAALHETARMVEGVANEIIAESAISALIAQRVGGAVSGGDVASEINKLNQRVGNAEQQARGIGADVVPQIKALGRGIEAGVNESIGSLDKELSRLEHGTIPAIQGEIAASDRAIGNLWEWIHKHTVIAATTAFAGAVAWAIAKTGAGWIRCNNWNKIGKQVCATPGTDIEALLGLLFAGFAIADYQDLVKIAQQETKLAAEGIKLLLRV